MDLIIGQSAPLCACVYLCMRLSLSLSGGGGGFCFFAPNCWGMLREGGLAFMRFSCVCVLGMAIELTS